MTEFEEQVATALEMPITMFGLLNVSGTPKEISKQLAPRIAAAIEAAHGTQGPKAREILRHDALIALRGAP